MGYDKSTQINPDSKIQKDTFVSCLYIPERYRCISSASRCSSTFWEFRNWYLFDLERCFCSKIFFLTANGFCTLWPHGCCRRCFPRGFTKGKGGVVKIFPCFWCGFEGEYSDIHFGVLRWIILILQWFQKFIVLRVPFWALNSGRKGKIQFLDRCFNHQLISSMVWGGIGFHEN